MKNKISAQLIISIGATAAALMMFSACNHSNSTTTVVVSTGSNGSSGGIVCPAWGCGSPPIVSVGIGYSSGGCNTECCAANNYCGYGPSNGGSTGVVANAFDNDGTKDVDLQRAEIQDQSLNNRAQAIATKFDMDFGSAHQLAVLADRVQTLTAQGAVSADDEQGVIQAAIGIAGLSQDEINSAIVQSLQGNESATNSLMEKAAQNLGMSSTATLRDQLLPALGLSN